MLNLIDEASRAGASRKAACAMIELNSRTVQRWRKELRDDARKNNRFAVTNALSKAEKKRVIEVLTSPEFRDMGPHQIVPILADRKVYLACESTFYRLLHSEGLFRHRQNSRPPMRKKPKELIATGSNQIWTWDISTLLTNIKGKFYYLYMVLDIWDRMIVGWDVCERESGELATELFREICLRENVKAGELFLHQDNGGPMISAEFRIFMEQFEIKPSYSRPGVSDDNPYSESLFRTVKYRPGYPLRFESLEEAKLWLEKFVQWYNFRHRHSGINFVTPAQRRKGEDKKILSNRRNVYAKARLAHPERWSGNVRKWQCIDSVSLNPRKSKKDRQALAV